MKKLTIDLFIERAEKLHNNKYDYSEFKYVNSKIKGKIICPKHGEFYQIPNAHLRGIKCPKCSNNLKSSTFEFIKKSQIIHGDKYDYSKVDYINNKTPVTIICKLHGKFKQTPSHNLQNVSGCIMCKGSQKHLSTKTFIKKSKLIHKNKYNYSNVNYKRWDTPVKIVCRKHGMFWQIPHGHLCGQGCPKCKGELNHIRCNKGIKRFVFDAKIIHKNKYDYSNSIYKTTNTKMKIICKKHGKFYQTPKRHIAGVGCPKCSNIISKPEIEFLNYIKIPNTKNNRQKYLGIGKIKVDGIRNNTIYEFLGDYWHGNPDSFNKLEYNKKCHKTFGELYKNTFKKFDKLKENGYEVNYIWESAWKEWIKDKIGDIPIQKY